MISCRGMTEHSPFFGVVDVLLNAHELLNFLYRPLTDRNTAPHLVTIEVCVKARNAQRVDSQRALVRQLRFKARIEACAESAGAQ